MTQRILALFALFLFLAPANLAAGARRVFVWLEGDSLAVAHARSVPPLPGLRRPFRINDADVQAQRAALRATRQSVVSRLKQLGFIEDGETDVVLHSLAGRMPEENIEAASHLPGVRMLRPVREYRPLLDAAVPLVRAPSAWTVLGGETKAGAGIRIAVLDTGIDTANPMLQDPTLAVPTGFPKGQLAFTNSKVIAARSYLSLLGNPRDTDDAMDRDGHGTFVAAIAAGHRALAPWASIAGVAPAAQLGNYRIFSSPIFGDSGGPITTDAAIVAAINDAVADGMNVVNISAGMIPIDLPSAEPVPQAVAAAVQAGVIVVAAAGNDGDYLETVSDPADTPSAIAVGASRNSRLLGNPFRVLAPQPVSDALQRVVAVPSSTTSLTAAIGPVALWHPSDEACNAPANATDFRGKIVIALDDGNCTRGTKLANMAAAGAVAGVIYRSDSDDPREMMFSTPPALPAFQISKDAGRALVAMTNLNTQGQAAIDAGAASFPVSGDLLLQWSSRGPNIDGELKPDLVAPGTSIYSAFQVNDALGDFYSTAQFGLSDGTSFSSPMVAGAAALVKQAHSDWTPAQVKSALVNTANTNVMEAGQSASVLGIGNGRLDAGAAMNSGVAFDPVGLSFTSSLLTGTAVTVHRTLKVTNIGIADTFSLDLRPRTDMTGATITINPRTLSLGPRESASVDVAFQSPASVKGSASLDGRIAVQSGSGGSYSVAYWGQVVESSQIYDLFRLRGDGQTGPISSTLPVPLVAQVIDQNYIGIAGVPVRFQITTGAGTLSATQVTTDFAGTAQVMLTLPAAPGMVQVTASVNGSVSKTFTATARPAPVVPQGGVVNAASYTTPVSPGGIVAIFGSGLAAGTSAAGGLPLPTTLASAQVLFNGQPAPLFFASPGQINALVPFELYGKTSATVQVTVSGMVGAPVSVALSGAAPGLLTLTQDGRGTIVAQHVEGGTYSPVTTTNPAHAGDVIVIYGLGFGLTQPAVASGVPAPGAEPLASTTVTPTVSIGSSNAQVIFSGLTPGLVGLYQVNFKVPSGTATGDAVPLTLAIGSSTSNTVTLPVR